MLDAAGFVDPVFYGPASYLSEGDLPAGFIPDPDCPDCVVGLETFEDGTEDFGLTFSEGEIIGPDFETGLGSLTDSVDGDDGTIDGTGQTGDGGSSFFTFGNSITITLPSLMQSAGLVWTDGDPGITSVIFEAFDQDGNSLGTVDAGDIADDSIMGTTAEDSFFGISFGDGVATGVTAIAITNIGPSGLEIDHIQFANCSECCDDIDLEVTKDVDSDLVNTGDTVTWTVTVENNEANANAIATSVQVRDVLPAGLTFVSADETKGAYNQANGNWFVGSIVPGGSETLTLVTSVDAGLAPGTMIENVAEVFGANEDDVDSTPNNDDGDQSEDDEDSAKITIQGQSDIIDLEVTKVVDASIVNSGDTVTWTVDVENNDANANAIATSVVLLDVLPAGVTLVSADETKGIYNANGTWFIGSIAPGGQETLTLVTTVDAGLAPGTMIENVAQVITATQDDIDSTPNNDDGDQSEDDEDSAKITVQGEGGPFIDLELTKDVDVSIVSPGDTVTFTLEIFNNPADATEIATGVIVEDVLPAGLTFVSAVDTKGVYNPNNGTWFIGSLLSGQQETLTLTTTVDAGFDGQTITNVAEVFAANEPDIDSTPNNGIPTEDDQDSAEVFVRGGDGLMLSGFSYVDTNNDGIFQAIELPLLGVEIQLMGINSGINATTFTDINGFYKFNDLPADEYMVKQVQPVQFVDGQDTVGNLGGSNPENDKLNVSLNGNAEDYNFGELGLRPEFVNKRFYLTSTPYTSWEYIDVQQSSVWYSFNLDHQSLLDVNGEVASGVASFMVFDSSMTPISGGEVEGELAEPIALSAGQYYLQLAGGTVIDSLALDVTTPNVTIDGDTVIAVGTSGDDNIELHLGHDTHVLNISGLEYEFDATVVDTIHIGASTGHDHVTVHGTDLDDTADALGSNGHLYSSNYDVHTYSAENTTFVGGGGHDYSQLYGSLADDKLSALPHDVTLETPDNVLHVKDFARVDSYGRGGFDYAELYGTLSNDVFVAKDSYSYVSGGGTLSYTKDFERVDGYGRGGNDIAQLFDSAGNDYYYSTPSYSVIATGSRINKIKGFETIEVESTNGGTDTAKFVGLKTGDSFHAHDDIALLERAGKDEEIEGFHHVIAQAAADQNPSALISATDYLLTEDADWI